MYTFILKDNGPDLEIVITRSMLALAAITAMVYRTDEYYFLNLLSFISLFLAAVFINTFLVKFRINKLVLLFVASVVLFIATHSIAFAVILLVYGYLVKFLYKKPAIEVTNDGITIRKLFANPTYPWSEFSNIILKDGLLTLDFKNNNILQVSVDENRTVVDEKAFNDYCKGFI